MLEALLLNEVRLIGNLGRDPDKRYTQDGRPVVTLSVATNEKWKNKSGEWEEHVEWHRVVVFGQQADNCSQYLRKGSRIAVLGSLTTRSWDDEKSGEKKYMTEVKGYRIVFLDRKDGGAGHRDDGYRDGPSDQPTGGVYDGDNVANSVGGAAGQSNNVDKDIPF